MSAFLILERGAMSIKAQYCVGAIEVVATLKVSKKIRALVTRFEGVDRRWLCTEFELL